MVYSEEANNERKAPTEIKKNGESSEKKSPELVCMEEELQKWSAESFIDLTASGEPLRSQIILD
jgi:hypothetical protein